MITSALFGKFGIVAILIAVGGVGGMFLQHKVLAPRPERIRIDYDQVRAIVAEEVKKIPEPTVAIQPFNAEQIKKLREFNYSPQFSGSVSVSGVDTAAVKRYIEMAVMKAFEKHIVTTDKRKRR